MRHTAKTVHNMKANNSAKFIKETEKAVYIKFAAWVGEKIAVVKAWMPKSQIEIVEIKGDKIYFNTKNNWILGAKVRDYVKYVCENEYANCAQQVLPDFTTFLHFGRNEEIDRCFC